MGEHEASRCAAAACGPGETQRGVEALDVTIYTDGACSGNPGPGGWAAILIADTNQKEISGFAAETTNNRMELTAVVEGLKALKRPCDVHVRSDSSYLVNAFRKRWIANWQKNGWRTSAGRPVENQDLWQELLASMRPHQVQFEWVKGHSENPLNNRCDELARQAIKRRAGTE